MNNSNKTYTYRGGQKVELEKSPVQMAIQSLPDTLDNSAIVTSEQAR